MTFLDSFKNKSCRTDSSDHVWLEDQPNVHLEADTQNKKTIASVWTLTASLVFAMALTSCGGEGSGSSDIPGGPGGTANGKTFMDYCAGEDTTEAQIHTIRQLYLAYNLDPKRDLCRLVITSANLQESIDLSSRGITDLSPISGFKDVTSVDLTGNLITDASTMCNMPNLQMVNLSMNSLTELPDMRATPSVAYLNLSANPITDLASIDRIQNTRVLWLRQTEVKDLSALSALSRLEQIDLSSLAHPESLRTLPAGSYTGLGLEENNLTELRTLSQKFPKLQVLMLNDNKLESLAGLEALPDLKFLLASHNTIRSITRAQLPTEMDYLELADNPIQNFDFMRKLEKVKTVDLSLTPLASFDSINHLLRSVKELFLRETQLTALDFSEFSNTWYALEALDISNTPIASLAPLEGVSADRLKSFAAYDIPAINKDGNACPTSGVPDAVRDFCISGYDAGGYFGPSALPALLRGKLHR